MTKELPRSTDSRLAQLIGAALGERVNDIMRRQPVANPPTTLDSVRRRAAARQGRRRMVAAAALVAVVVLAGAGTALRHTGATRRVRVVAGTPAAALPRLTLHAPKYRLFRFNTYANGSGLQQMIGLNQLHVRNGTTWFDIATRPGADTSGGIATRPGADTSGGSAVQVGLATGRLHQDEYTWQITWDVAGKHLVATGPRTVQPKIIGILSSAQADPGGITFSSLPGGYDTSEFPDPGEQYGAAFVAGTHSTATVSLEVQKHRAFDADYFTGQQQISRGGRLYFVALYGEFTTISWFDGPAVITLNALLPSDELLALADAVTAASPQEWADMVALDGLGDTPSVFNLLDGKINGTPWEFLSHTKSTGAVCQSVEFVAGDTSTETCIADSDPGPVRLLRATRVGGTAVLYGLTDNTAPDSYVVRVIDDASDEIVAEDVTQDQTSIAGRVFVLPLDGSAQGPFTVEVYEFDRRWYIENYDNADNRPDDSYLRPDSEPVASLSVAAPESR